MELSDFTAMLHLDYLSLEEKFSSQTDLFTTVAERLQAFNLVTDAYLPALLTREKDFPTGLDPAHCHIAIPHLDASFHSKAFLYFCRLKEPLSFTKMGSKTEHLSVKLVFFLGFTNPQSQLRVLQRLMILFQRSDVLRTLSTTNSQAEIFNLLYVALAEPSRKDGQRHEIS